MNSNIKLAWRNLWRNKGRTLITVASVFFGVLISTVMSSMQEGSYTSMVDNVVRFYSGYIQIHQEDYWENKTINNIFEPTDSIISILDHNKYITDYTPRLESFALASSENMTKGAMITGVNPEKENHVTQLKKWIKEGTYLKSDDDGILLGYELAKYLKLNVDDTLVLMGQGYHGISAIGKYPVRGLLKFPNPAQNSQTVYMELRNAQELYSTGNQLTAMVLMIEDAYHLSPAMKTLKTEVHSPYSVMSWSEMSPEILQMIDGDRAGAVMMKGLLYILVGFGIFGTIMTMIMERRREMGVLVAIGMQKGKLAIILLYETILIGIIGVLAGFAGSIPIIAYLYNNPIELTGNTADTMIQMGMEPYMYFSWLPSVFYNQVITVFAMIIVIAVYPITKAFTLKVHEALRA